MKRNITFYVLIVIVLSTYLLSCEGTHRNFLKTTVTISDLIEKQSVFADSMVTLHNVRVLSSESILNYTKSVISDKYGKQIIYFSDTPFRQGELIVVTGKMLVLYQKGDESILVFVDSQLNPVNDLLRLIGRMIGL